MVAFAFLNHGSPGFEPDFLTIEILSAASSKKILLRKGRQQNQKNKKIDLRLCHVIKKFLKKSLKLKTAGIRTSWANISFSSVRLTFRQVCFESFFSFSFDVSFRFAKNWQFEKKMGTTSFLQVVISLLCLKPLSWFREPLRTVMKSNQS